jgi:hypothetical protein
MIALKGIATWVLYRKNMRNIGYNASGAAKASSPAMNYRIDAKRPGVTWCGWRSVDCLG